MITTIALYVALCSSPTTCDNYVPATWTASSQEELSQVYDQCAKEEQTYMGFKGYKESDCYVINTTN